MKKYLLLLMIPFLLLKEVSATTIIQSLDNSSTVPQDFNSSISNYIYQSLIPQYSSYHYLFIYDEENDQYVVYFFDYNSSLSFDTQGTGFTFTFGLSGNNRNITTCVVDSSLNSSCYNELSEDTVPIIVTTDTVPPLFYYTFYDSDYNFINDIQSIELTDFYSDSIVINQGDSFPTLKNLYQYSSWSDYENNHLENYTEVNLDNYEYVLLSLKNYDQKNAFQTNLQVEGMIGITPIYNFGQTSKDSVTGVQVQDRCNLSYSSYTAYPFYILQSDLQNNAIYAVKQCESGSSFKFDNTIFDITYVTAVNRDDPIVTINGNVYHTIPFSDLPSTANQNEENNYIPGESENVINGNTGGLDSAIKNVQQKMSEIWSTFTYFTDFIGQLFSTLPVELRTVLLSAFTIAIILGLIKIFIN